MDTSVLLPEAVNLLCQLIETPRASRDEAAASQVVASFLSARRIPFRQIGANIILQSPHFSEELPTLMLCAHLDTVRPTSSWTRPPFSASLEGDALYGIGSNDDGASLVSLVQVFRLLCQRQQPYNLLLVLSAEEEVSGSNGFESLLPQLPHVDVALVGEPTGMQPAIAEKGLMVLDVVEQGQAGHAARNEGDNAIYHAVDDIQWFRTYQFPKMSPLLGAVKMTVTVIQAGTQHNVVPAQCTFTVDVRSNELYSNREIFDLVSAHVKGKVSAHSFRLNSSQISPTHPLVRRAIALGGTPFGSPTLSDQALMPFPSLKMGPGESCRSHSADEFVLVSEISEAISHYYSLLNGTDISGAAS
ncbi:MAG: M20 family metallo-hydrolase [Prevotellaceae bacterium]|nr:M20 family metallo-hydrolase [Prevotellaceae bacterium]